MSLTAQSVQSIGDLFLVRVFRKADGNGADSELDDGEESLQNDSGGDQSIIDQTPSCVVSSWVGLAAKALQEQWPRQEEGNEHEHEHEREEEQEQQFEVSNVDETNPMGSESKSKDADNNGKVDDCGYYRNYIVHHEQSFPRYSLACSYLLVQHKADESEASETMVVGHGRLTECYESAGGNAAAATYILIHPEWRGKGLGKRLLRLLELEARSEERLGCQYHFVYLWCKKSTAPFYEQSGYLRSRNRVSLQRPCLKALAASSVQSLEAILQRRREHLPTAAATKVQGKAGKSKKKLETVVLLPSASSNKNKMKNSTHSNQEQDVPQEEDVWLRKRLVDHVESIRISETNRMDELNEFMESIHPLDAACNTRGSYCYRWNPCVPWQMQIGPSCGLTAIRMVRDFYCSANQGAPEQAHSGDSIPERSSLLVDAQNRGYTQDGEVFDANHLRELMEDQLIAVTKHNFSLSNDSNGCVHSLAVRMRETSTVTVGEIESTLQLGGLWILPYDSHPLSKLPCRMHGKHAHWGIVVGILCSRPKSGTATTDNRESSSSSLIPLEDDPQFLFNNDRSSANANDPSGVHWVVQHSLSSKWAIATMDEWVDSNRQLVSVNDTKFTLGRDVTLNLTDRIIQILPAHSNGRCEN